MLESQYVFLLVEGDGDLFGFVLLCFAVERCMSVMQSGTQMVKLKSGTKGLVRLFYLDEHRTCIRWRPSRKSEKAKSKLLMFLLISWALQYYNVNYRGRTEQYFLDKLNAF